MSMELGLALAIATMLCLAFCLFLLRDDMQEQHRRDEAERDTLRRLSHRY